MNLNAGAILSTPGELQLTGGTLNLVSGGAPTAQTFTMSGGTLTGSDAFTVNGATTWTAGTMSGSGSTVAAGGLTLSSTSNKDLDERTLVNQATGIWDKATSAPATAPSSTTPARSTSRPTPTSR